MNAECAQGQIDINTATTASIASVLRFPFAILTKWVVAERPWLKVSDLSSVPGFPPRYVARIASRLCATQPVLPAAAPLACHPATRAVDLQSASAATISRRLLLPYFVAREIVAARPLPQDLDQVGSPRILALPSALLRLMVGAGRVCVTPAPMNAGGAGWRWATVVGGAVVTRDGFSLIVPPGRITAALGAYISVTPLSPDGGILPRMDGHIWGPWNTPATTVAVQGPWYNGGDPSLSPVLIHHAAGGDSESVGAAVAVSTVGGASTLTGIQTSLSPSTFGAAPGLLDQRVHRQRLLPEQADRRHVRAGLARHR